MATTGILDWIDVGSVAAERDENLSNYFYDNGVTRRVLDDPSAFLVLGRKGAGKTAVFRHLAENPAPFLSDNDILVPLSFEDYNWNIHALLQKHETAESLAYKQSWRFVILVEALKALDHRTDQDGRDKPKKLALAIDLLRKIFDRPVPTIYQIIGRKLLGLSKVKLPRGGIDLSEGDLESLEVGGGEVEFEEVSQSDDLRSRLSQNLDNLITYLEDGLVACAGLDYRVFVCFDRVDEAWDEVSVDVSKRVIAGLVSAADAVSAKHKKLVRPVVFLREDIFETLSLNDANKLREDCGALLHWDRESIFRVLQTRLNYFATKAGATPPEAFDDLFDKREMRQRAKPSSYLLKRSMMRPRDMICFIKRTIDAAKQKRDDPFAEESTSAPEKLPTDAIYDAEPGYSEWLKKELLDEWQVQYPKLGALLDVLQNYGSTNIASIDLAKGIKGMNGPLDRSGVLRHMAFLFDNSIIGFKVGDSTAWRFKCFYASQGFLEADEFHVHDGLIRVLNLREPRDRQEDS